MANITVTLFWDMDLRKWTTTLGGTTEQGPIEGLVQGAKVLFNVKFVQGGAAVTLASPDFTASSIKAQGDFTGSYLIQLSAPTGTPPLYTFTVDPLNSANLNTFLQTYKNTWCVLEIYDSVNDIPTTPLELQITPGYSLSGTPTDNAPGRLIVAAGKTATISNSVTLTGTDGESYDLDAFGASGLTVGTTTVTGGTTTRVLFDNAGVVGEYAVSGTGSVALTGSPTITTPTISGDLTIFGTSGNIKWDGGSFGYMQLEQMATPAAAGSALRLFTTDGDSLKWIGGGGLVTQLVSSNTVTSHFLPESAYIVGTTGTISLTLGQASGAAGTLLLNNATSTGTTTLANANVSASNYTATLPAVTGTVAVAATSTTATQALFATATAGAPAYRAIAASDLPATTMYASPSGSDGNSGLTAAAPKTLTGALAALGGSGRLFLVAGTYTSGINLSVITDIEIIGIGDAIFQLGESHLGSTFTAESGIVYRKVITTVPVEDTDGGNWMFYDTPSGSTSGETHPRQNGAANRLAYTQLKPKTGANLAAAIAAVQATPGSWYYHTATATLYVSQTDSGNVTTAGKTFYIPSETSTKSAVYGGTTSTLRVVIRNVKSRFGYHAFDLIHVREYELHGCQALGAASQGVLGQDNLFGLEVDCEYAANRNDGTAQQWDSGTSAIYTISNPWSHDNGDEGISPHVSGCLVIVNGGLLEHNYHSAICTGGGRAELYGVCSQYNNPTGVSTRASVADGVTFGSGFITGTTSTDTLYLHNCVSTGDRIALYAGQGNITSYNFTSIAATNNGVSAASSYTATMYGHRDYGSAAIGGGAGTVVFSAATESVGTATAGTLASTTRTIKGKLQLTCQDGFNPIIELVNTSYSTRSFRIEQDTYNWRLVTSVGGTGFRISPGGELTLDPSGGDVKLSPPTGYNVISSKPIRLASYTKSQLDALSGKAAGDTAFCTDALAPTFGAALAGSGAVKVPVYYDGAAWMVG